MLLTSNDSVGPNETGYKPQQGQPAFLPIVETEFFVYDAEIWPSNN